MLISCMISSTCFIRQFRYFWEIIRSLDKIGGEGYKTGIAAALIPYIGSLEHLRTNGQKICYSYFFFFVGIKTNNQKIYPK